MTADSDILEPTPIGNGKTFFRRENVLYVAGPGGRKIIFAFIARETWEIDSRYIDRLLALAEKGVEPGRTAYSYLADPPMTWHWKGDKRICDQCGGEVYIFTEGAICTVCNRHADAAAT